MAAQQDTEDALPADALSASTDMEISKPVSEQASTSDWNAHFIETLRKEIVSNRGKAAALRRASGETLATARNVAWFYGTLQRSGIKEKGDENAAFLIATLFAGDKNALEGKYHTGRNLGGTLELLKRRAGSTGEDRYDRRLKILLDSTWQPRDGGGDLPFRLRQVVRFILSSAQDGRIDWPRLYTDIRQWRSENRTSQKRWARSFYAPLLDTAAVAESSK